jgi:nitrogen fixation NifU-like protein
VANGMLAGVAFEGSGCSISQASASMMTEAVAGRPVDDVLGLAGEFRSFMEGGSEPDEEAFGDLIALKGVVKYPVRIKCAVLAWDVLQDALASDAAVASGDATH